MPSERCTSTLSMTTWKNSGETRPSSCRKNEASMHLAQQMAILVDCPQKPGDVEPSRDVGQSGAAGHQDQPTVPDRGEFVPRHQHGSRRQRRLDQDLFLVGLGDQQEAAIAQRRDRRQRRAGKPRPVSPIGLGLESHIPGAPEHFRCANLVRSQPMRDLSGIGRNALEMQQCHEGLETWIDRSPAVRFGAHGCSPGRRASGVRLRQLRMLAGRRIGDRHGAETLTRRDEARRHELAEPGCARGR